MDRNQPIKGRATPWNFRRDALLYVLLALPIAYFLLFRYGPMYGVSIAFKDYNIFAGVWESDWNGWTQFQELFSNRQFYQVVWNTLFLNLLDLLVGFPIPILLALLINEIRMARFKKAVQTLLYLPHFLSWVIIGGLVLQVFAPDRGLVNIVLKAVGLAQVDFLTNGLNWVAVYVGAGVWQSAGWGTIIYLAAMAGVSPELYEAAQVDGASRYQRIRHITLPSIAPVIVILFILQVGRVTSISFDRPFILSNPLVTDYAQVISTYVYDVGLKSMRHNLATAVGLFQSAIGLVLLLLTNWVAEKNGQKGIYR
jgi:putative aldouronate transport system permease protein